MTSLPQDDHTLFGLMRTELFTAVVGDVMDRIGLRRQFLPPEIRPLSPDMVVVGRAMPVLETDCYADLAGGPGPLSDRAFGLVFEALDSLRPGEVYVASGVSGSFALWGELMSTRARLLGATGAVLHGYARDTRGILAMGFPTFAHGSYGQDQGVRGKVVDYRVPVEIGAARIMPGDIVFGDIDGVLVIPAAQEAEVIAAALEKVRGEKVVAKAIAAGMSTVEAFRTYGIM